MKVEGTRRSVLSLERLERNEMFVKQICSEDAVTKIEFVARTALEAALSLATHRKAQQQLPLGRLRTRYFSNLKGRASPTASDAGS